MAKGTRIRADHLFTGAGLILVAFMAFLTGGSHVYAVIFLIVPAILLVIFFPLPIFLLFIASFPFNVIPAIEGFSIPKLIGYVLFLAWALYIFRTKRADLLRMDRISLNFLVFIGWGLITVFWCEQPLKVPFIAFTLLQLWVFYIIAMSLIDKVSKLEWVVYACLGSCTYVAAISIIKSIGQLRSVGVEGSDENEFAALMIFPIYLSLNLAMYYKNIWLRLLFGLLIILLMLGAASTVSRGFLVAIMVSFVYRIFLDVDKKRALAAVLLVLVLTGPFLLIRYAKRAEVEPPIYVKELPSGRMAIWIVGMEIIKAHPILGVGAGGFSFAFDDEYQENRYKTGFVGYRRVGHNDFITILAEYGIIGLIIWLSMIVYIVRESYRLNYYFLKVGDKYLFAVANAVASALLGLLLCQAFLGLYISKFLWLAIAFIPILKTIAKQKYGLEDKLL
jgi:putative inorganic carbon (HCO3(-)) transporter